MSIGIFKKSAISLVAFLVSASTLTVVDFFPPLPRLSISCFAFFVLAFTSMVALGLLATANITLGLGLQNCNADEQHPEMLQEALTDVDQHYDKCKQADEQKRIAIEKKRQEKLRRERIRKEKREYSNLYGTI